MQHKHNFKAMAPGTTRLYPTTAATAYQTRSILVSARSTQKNMGIIFTITQEKKGLLVSMVENPHFVAPPVVDTPRPTEPQAKKVSKASKSGLTRAELDARYFFRMAFASALVYQSPDVALTTAVEAEQLFRAHSEARNAPQETT